MCHVQAYTFRQARIGLCYKRDEAILNQFCRDSASVIPLKIHSVCQWLPVFRLNYGLLPSVSPIMWLSVVPDGVGIQYYCCPHSVPMAPSFSINDTLIQYQWRPQSVPMAPPFSINDDIAAWASSCCMPFVVMSLLVIRCHTVIYVSVLRICHSRPLPPSAALVKAVSRRRWVR